MTFRVEIAVQDVDGLTIARESSAHRVEVCSGLSLGGLTPSMGLVDQIIAAAEDHIEAHVLIRPRPGSFVVSDQELAVMIADIHHAVNAGASGVVVGSLQIDAAGHASIDRWQLDSLVTAAQGSEVTFHRAIDQVEDVFTAIEALVDAGVTRILTSGGASSVHDGLPRLAHTVGAAAGRIQVMAGGGLNLDRLDEVLKIGVDAVHLSGKRIRTAPTNVAFGNAVEDGLLRWDETDAAVVARAVGLVGDYSLR